MEDKENNIENCIKYIIKNYPDIREINNNKEKSLEENEKNKKNKERFLNKLNSFIDIFSTELRFQEGFKIEMKFRGQGNMPDCPSIPIFFEPLSNEETKGYYVVILFKKNMKGFYVSLNQGITWFEKNNKNNYIRYMADLIRKELNLKDKYKMNLESEYAIAYEKANIYSKEFDADAFDGESVRKAIWNAQEYLYNIYEIINKNSKNGNWEQFNYYNIFLKYCENNKTKDKNAGEGIKEFKEKFGTIAEFSKMKLEGSKNSYEKLIKYLNDKESEGPDLGAGRTKDAFIMKKKNGAWEDKEGLIKEKKDIDRVWKMRREQINNLLIEIQNAKKYSDIGNDKILNVLFIHKLAYNYFPNKIIGIGKEEYLKEILEKLLGIYDYEKDMSKIQLAFFVKQHLKKIEEIKQIPIPVLTGLIWDFFGWKAENNESSNIEGEKQKMYSSSNESKGFKLNTILQGPPGTGKTYWAIRYAILICNKKDRSPENINEIGNLNIKDVQKAYESFKEQIEFTTFHQSYDYEDFIEGIKPDLDNKELKYIKKAGVLKRICKKASENSKKNYVLIIDEINRGNISKIFGELITLIEEKKRSGMDEELSVTLPYTDENEAPFTIPKNLYIIGTMNTADRSIALMDTALRRRFNFEEIYPQYDLLPESITIDRKKINIRAMLEKINSRIEVLYDREHQIGHSYFIPIKTTKKSEVKEVLKNIFKNQILPLLQEYFYDDYGKIKLVLGKSNFIREKTMDNIFNSELDEYSDILEKKIYDIDEEQFDNIQNYIDIYQ